MLVVITLSSIRHISVRPRKAIIDIVIKLLSLASLSHLLLVHTTFVIKIIGSIQHFCLNLLFLLLLQLQLVLNHVEVILLVLHRLLLEHSQLLLLLWTQG